MADLKISELVTYSSAIESAVFPVVQYDTTGKITLANLRVSLLDGRPINLIPPLATPTAPVGGISLFGRSLAGRILPAFVGPSGLDSVLQASLYRNKVALWSPVGNGTTITTVGAAAIIATGTATAANVSVGNRYAWQKRIEYLAASPSPAAVAGFRYAALQWGRGNNPGSGGFTFVCRFGLATGPSTAPSNYRVFVGLTSSVAAPTDVNPSTLTNCIGVGMDASDGTFSVISNSASGTATKQALSHSRSYLDRTETYEVAIFCPPYGNVFKVEFTDLTTGEVDYREVTSNIPSASVLLAPRGFISAGGVSTACGLALMLMAIETDY